MLARSIAIPFILLLTLGCATGRGDLDSAAREAIVSEVRQALEAFGQATNAGDPAAVAAFYADDPRFLWAEDGLRRYGSPAEIRSALEQASAYGAFVVEYGDPAIEVLGPDLVHVFTTHRTTIGDPAAGGFAFGGAVTAVLVRTAEGWQFLAGHSSTERPRGG